MKHELTASNEVVDEALSLITRDFCSASDSGTPRCNSALVTAPRSPFNKLDAELEVNERRVFLDGSCELGSAVDGCRDWCPGDSIVEPVL